MKIDFYLYFRGLEYVRIRKKFKKFRIVENTRRTVESSQRVQYLRDRVGGNFVTGCVQILHLAVVGPLVGHVERRRDGTAVRVFTSLLEQIGVKALVQVVHGIVER